MRPWVLMGVLITLCLWLVSCAPESDVQEVQVSRGPDGMAQLAWMPGSDDPSVLAYFVHYGTVSPGVPGSCDYQESRYVEGTQTEATVTDLTPGTVYYFTVSAYNGLESPCSEEISYIDQ